jgi:FkbM family methyltransferase
MSDLIYDIGMHDGDDSEFYLLKGFRVVAVEAEPQLCQMAAERFRPVVESGQLIIVNRAITPRSGPATFYRSSSPGWGTVVEEWNQDNNARGVAGEPMEVDGITLADLVETYGDAFYLKLDIEGMDRIALASLAGTSVRPPYVSIETSFSRIPRIGSIRSDFDTLTRLGYDRFKIVDQNAVADQVPPAPPLVGRYVPFRFTSGASGLFGEETPGEWLIAEDALASFRRICRKKWLEMLLYRKMRLYLFYCKVMYRLSGKYSNLGWYDIHAKHSSVE